MEVNRSFGDAEIRPMFSLQNVYGEEDIGYSLVSMSIDKVPPYGAFPYAQDKTFANHTLREHEYHHADESTFALYYLQRPYSSRLLSIDVLCIHQHNNMRPSRQAQPMARIYATA